MAEEQLYRHLNGDWIDADGLVTGDAIDLQGTSVDRGRYVTDPLECLAGTKAHFVAVGAIAFGQVPDRFEVLPKNPNDPPPMPYESLVVYVPRIPHNVAHSEIRFHRPGATKASTPGSDAMRSEIRDRLAERLHVVCRR